jgi:hypothetical protein
MSFKDVWNEERQDLQSVKRPYETAAFLLFALFFLQQIVWLLVRMYDYLFDDNITSLSTTHWLSANYQNWIGRIIGHDSDNWLFILAGLGGFLLYYFVVYVLVWNYCKRHNLAKWTWTFLVVYVPFNLFFVPTIIWFALYVFRPYIMRFMKRAYAEFQSFDPATAFPEEVEAVVDEEAEPTE